MNYHGVWWTSSGNGSGNGSGSGGGGSGHASRSGTPARAAAAAADPTFSGEFTAGAIAFACECGKQYPKWASMLGHLKGTGHFNANRSRDHAELKKKCDGTNRAGPRTTIVVQNDEVAKLVGKDGENLDDISARSGANLRVAKDDGDGIRKVTISGTKSQLQKCKVLIKEKTGKKAVTAKKHSAKQRKAEGTARLFLFLFLFLSLSFSVSVMFLSLSLSLSPSHFLFVFLRLSFCPTVLLALSVDFYVFLVPARVAIYWTPPGFPCTCLHFH